MNAAPTPMAISVNMLSWRVTSEVQPRWKNGHPPHSTIGAASASCTHGETAGSSSRKPNRSAPIETISSGIARTVDTHRRRVKSISSGFGASSSEGASGSSAIPQIGQLPGPSRRICECIGHVQIAPAGAAAAAMLAGVSARYFPGSAVNLAAQPALQKWNIAPPCSA
jgi:hypothetical protein